MRFEHLIETLGLPGMVVGTILEGDVVAFLGGVLAHRGLFAFEAAALAGALGAFLVDNLFFWIGRHMIGRHMGQRGFVRRLLDRPGVERWHGVLRRHPVLAVLGFRYVYGMKSAGAVLIGTTGLTWFRFAVLDALAVVLWCNALMALGYGAGRTIEAALGRQHLALHLGLALGLFLVLAGAAFLWARRARKGDRR